MKKLITLSLRIVILFLIISYVFGEVELNVDFLEMETANGNLIDGNEKFIVVCEKNKLKYYITNDLENYLNIEIKDLDYIKNLKVNNNYILITSKNKFVVLDFNGKNIEYKSLKYLFDDNPNIISASIYGDYITLGLSDNKILVYNFIKKYKIIEESKDLISTAIYYPKYDTLIYGSLNKVYFKVDNQNLISYKCKGIVNNIKIWNNNVIVGDSLGNIYVLDNKGNLIKKLKVYGSVKKLIPKNNYLIVLDDSSITVFDSSYNEVFSKSSFTKSADIKNNILVFGKDKIYFVILPKIELTHPLFNKYSNIDYIKLIGNDKILIKSNNNLVLLKYDIIKTPPKLIIEEPVSYKKYYENSPIPIRAYAKDNNIEIKKFIVKINGNTIFNEKTSKVDKEIFLKNGKYTITFTAINSLGLSKTKSITINVNEPEPGELIVNTIPNGCKVRIKEINKEFISPVDIKLKGGVYTIYVEKEHYYPNITKVVISPQNITKVNIILNDYPKLTIDAPHIITTENDYATANIKITASDDFGLKKINIYLNGKLIKEVYPKSTNSIKDLLKIKVNRGYNNIKVEVVDIKGLKTYKVTNIKVLKLPITYITLGVFTIILFLTYFIFWKKRRDI